MQKMSQGKAAGDGFRSVGDRSLVGDSLEMAVRYGFCAAEPYEGLAQGRTAVEGEEPCRRQLEEELDWDGQQRSQS